MRWLPILLLPLASAQPTIVGIAPDIPDGEALAIHSPQPWDMTGWAVTDGEDTWRLPDGLVIDGTQWFAGGDGWAARQGTPALRVDWPLRLGNDGDDVRLLAPGGSAVDEVLYGDKTTSTWGDLPASRWLVLQRSPGVDTDRAADWQTPRPHRIGESNWPAIQSMASAVTTMVAPDNIHGALAGLIDGAERRLHLHVYTLTHDDLSQRLAAAAGRGVDVQVLITNRPVGQDAFERSLSAAAANRIQQSGGSVWVAGDERYRYHHLKVLVADDDVAVQSENWVPSGVPEDPSHGNRGWGVVLHDVADDIVPVLAADREAWDTTPFALDSYDPDHEAPPAFSGWAGIHRPTVRSVTIAGPIRVDWVVGPDHTADPLREPVSALVASASQRVWAQQLDLASGAANDLGWYGPDPFHQALSDAGSRLDARIMVAAPFRSTDTGNAEALATLPTTVARCQPSTGLTIHNKGTIVDDAVVVGSMNGNHHSRSMNRELAVIVHDAEVAAAFAEVFLLDWGACKSDEPMPAPVPMLLLVALVVVARCCPRSPSLR